jgi:hypothetical protein
MLVDRSQHPHFNQKISVMQSDRDLVGWVEESNPTHARVASNKT